MRIQGSGSTDVLESVLQVTVFEETHAEAMLVISVTGCQAHCPSQGMPLIFLAEVRRKDIAS
jgi:hypothetical protein